MIIHMVIIWYDRNQLTLEPIYDGQHKGTVIGETPYECMKKYYELSNNHDLRKYTRMQIAGIY